MAYKKLEDFNLLHSFPEVAFGQDCIIATFQVHTATKDIMAFAKALADEQSTGTWIATAGETRAIKERFGAQLVGVYEIPEVNYTDPAGRYVIMQVAFPTHNLGDSYAMLMTTVLGNVASAGKVKLIDLAFPKCYVDRYKGPKFGMPGLRELLGVKDRPLLNAMIKPNIGWTPEEGARLFYEAAVGGCDVIKDDELLPADEAHCPLEKRVKLFMEAERQAYEETGEHTLYTVNITDRPERVHDNAKRALDAGANALMLNYYTVGFDVARSITEDPEINVPVMAHVDFLGALVSSPEYGLSPALLAGKLSRMCGADLAIFGSPYGKFPVGRSPYLRTLHYFTQPLFHIKPTMVAISGGTTQLVIHKIIKDLGTDIILAAGGAVHGHPDGSRAGAKSMRDAINAACNDIPLEEALKTSPELMAMAKHLGFDAASNFDLMK
ncbi:MAG: ribulose 1,5-bisphosphate carboxylase [Oscillospiraceae bacterium]|nr:ribulose 1,5-bisphosphate carboxylase [Oscillospiraceae bacterium]